METEQVESNGRVVRQGEYAEGMCLEERASDIIQGHVYTAVGFGLVPIPLVDVVALIGIQLNMVRRLANLYGVTFQKDIGKSIVSSLLGSLIPVAGAGPLASLLKMIPVIGYSTAVLSVSMFGGASTYAVGKVFMQHFASGGTFLDLDPAKVREHFRHEYEEGKDIAAKERAARMN